jgi:hypothetical protein
VRPVNDHWDPVRRRGGTTGEPKRETLRLATVMAGQLEIRAALVRNGSLQFRSVVAAAQAGPIGA